MVRPDKSMAHERLESVPVALQWNWTEGRRGFLEECQDASWLCIRNPGTYFTDPTPHGSARLKGLSSPDVRLCIGTLPENTES